MSGIAGIVAFDGSPVAAGTVEAMTAAMDYRGPDGITHWASDGAALGHCNLQTTPESLDERQPVISEDGHLVLVLDGRLDNWLELRQELHKRRVLLRDQSDAELLLSAYKVWGAGCLARIDGDFAFAIYDKRSGGLFCARDPMGNRSFNYYWSGGTFVFATDLHAVLAHPVVPRIVNRGVLAEFLASEWYSQDETFWQDVKRLVAAHSVSIDAAGLNVHKYWSPDLFAALEYGRDEEYIEHYHELFTQTVRRQSRSHKTLSAEVSGGLDSSAIFAVAENLRQKNQLSAPGLTGFTINFENDPDANEIEYCRAVGTKLGSTIVEAAPAKYPLSWFLDAATKYQDFPGYPNSVMAGNLMRLAQQGGSRVLFNGVGGDQWLGASRNYYAEEMAENRWSNVFGLIKQDGVSEGFLKSAWWLLRFGIAPLLPEYARVHWRRFRDARLDGFDRRAWLTPELRMRLEEQRARKFSDYPEHMRWPGQRDELDMLMDPYLAIANESHERFTASSGLELRRPFCSVAMVQFSFSVPKRLLFASGVNRYAHRQAMQGLLPDQVLERQTKAEFSVTYHQYIRQMEELLSREVSARRRDWVDQEQVVDLYEKIGVDRYAGWSEFMLWVLFGCDAFCPKD